MILFGIGLLATVIAASPTQAQTFTLLHSFPSSNDDGETPFGELALDAANNLYGTTLYGGGGKNYGTVFEIDASGLESVKYIFGPHGKAHDGIHPAGQVVQFDGIIYGTTAEGGGTGCDSRGCGTIFELQRGKDRIIHSFSESEGASNGGVVRDKAGNLYGITTSGSSGTVPPACPANGCGTVFAVIQGQESVLYTFTGMPDGSYPRGTLIVDRLGNLYGTTTAGGSYNKGTVYELSPNGDGNWTEQVLYNFTGKSDGGVPLGGVTIDPSGNLYGSTLGGGLDTSSAGTKCPDGCGVIFKLRKNADGSWAERALYKFAGAPTDGAAPLGALVRDKRGNLYGVTESGGAADKGIVFEIGQTNHAEAILHTFTGGPTDGASPQYSLIIDRWGVLYGTTQFGGAGTFCSCGTVFKVTIQQ